MLSEKDHLTNDVKSMAEPCIHCYILIFYFNEPSACSRNPSKWRMLKVPALKSSDLLISVFQDRSNRGAFNTFKKHSKTRKKVENYILNIFYAPKIANLGFFNFRPILS